MRDHQSDPFPAHADFLTNNDFSHPPFGVPIVSLRYQPSLEPRLTILAAELLAEATASPPSATRDALHF